MSEDAMVGWDFSRLDGRMWADEPPWDFEATCANAMADVTRVLDMGTGGGERLIALLERGPRPRRLVATEGWAPNLPVATRALAPYDVPVVPYDSETDVRMPFPAASFDLVMNRHESYAAAEVFRVLSPGGLFLTQQVDGNEFFELRDRYGALPTYPDVTLASLRAEAERAGFEILAADDWSGTLRFVDAGALDEYLRLVPWDRPAGFDPATLPPDLLSLTQLRFWVAARKPA